MYKVKYEKYRYGYGGTQEVKIFSSLEEIADWLFGMVKGKYEVLCGVIILARINTWMT